MKYRQCDLQSDIQSIQFIGKLKGQITSNGKSERPMNRAKGNGKTKIETNQVLNLHKYIKTKA